MLPLRSNSKPQLIPIKQLLMKQREENSHAEEEHNNLKTDDYLLWKSENEPNEKKSVSFSLKNDDIMRITNRDRVLKDNKRFQRTKHEIFLQDSGGLWDSDEADDSLQNQLDTLDHLKNYDYENAPNRLLVNNDKIRNRRKSVSSTSHTKKKDGDLVKKLIETLDLPTKESIHDMQHTLSRLLESKIAEEMSALKNNSKLDFLHEIDDKLARISKNLAEFEQYHQQELKKLKSDLLDHIHEVTNNEAGKSDDFKNMEERICNQITENFNQIVQNLIKNWEKLYEASGTDKYTKFYNENLSKLQELDVKIEALIKDTSKISGLVADTKQRNTKQLINVAPRRSYIKEAAFRIDDSNSNNFYQNIDAELEQYRSAYINNNFLIDERHQKHLPSFFPGNDNKWKPWQ